MLSPTNTVPAASMVGEPKKRALPVPKTHRPAPVEVLSAYRYLLPAPPPTTTTPPRTAGVDQENSTVAVAELFWAAHTMDPSAGRRAYTPVLPATNRVPSGPKAGAEYMAVPEASKAVPVDHKMPPSAVRSAHTLPA